MECHPYVGPKTILHNGYVNPLQMLNSTPIRDAVGHLSGNQWQMAEYSATSTLAIIFERLYSHDALRQSSACRISEIQASYSLLQNWRLNLPPPFDNINEEQATELCGRPRLWRAAQRLIVRYYGGIFFIFCPWLCLASEETTPAILDPETLAGCKAQCFRAAYAFISMADRISHYNIALEG